MGNLVKGEDKTQAILDTLNDARIDKVNKKLKFTDQEMITLYTNFNVFDTEGLGYITTDDFFKKLLEEPRTAFGDAALHLIEMKNSEILTFGEYLEFVAMFALFEEKDILSLAFKMYDPDKSGFVDKDELRFFIYGQHDDDQSSNIERGLQYLEDHDDGDSRFEFYQIEDMHKNFQQLFYPCFRLQIQVKRNCGLGERWWEFKKYQLVDEREEKRRETEAKEAADAKNAAMADEINLEKQVKERMKIRYWITPWARKKFRDQIRRIAAIRDELGDSDEEDGGDDDDD